MILVVLGGLLAGLGVAAEAAPAASAPSDPRIAPLSGLLPTAIRDEAITRAGPETGWLRTRVEGETGGNFLNTRTAPAAGGTEQYHLPIDLNVPWATLPGDPFYKNPEYAPAVNEDTNAGHGLLASVANTYHLSTVYTASDGSGDTFVSGIKGTDGASFQNWVYRLTGPGPCPGSGNSNPCVADQRVISGLDEHGRPIVTTAMAVGPFLAVGLTDGTVRLLAGVNQFAQWNVPRGDCCQAVVTSLAWGYTPQGDLLLAVGTMSEGAAGYILTVDGRGNISPTYQTWDQTGTDSLTTVPLSVAWGLDANGKPVVAYAVNSGKLVLVDPTSGATTATYTYPSGAGAPTNVTAVPRVDGTSGGDDWAVTVQPSSDILTATGSLIRFTGTTGSPVVLRPASSGDDGTMLKSLDDFRSWFPGWALGALAFGNNSSETLDVQLYARPEGGYGCWFGPPITNQGQLGDILPIPQDGIALRPGGSFDNYSIGAFTAGVQGKCNAGDLTSSRRGYLVISPTASQTVSAGSTPVPTRADDALIVNLTLNSNPLTYDVSDTSGGPISMTSQSFPQGQVGPYDQLVLTPAEPALPSPTGAPTIVKAVQLNNLSVRGRTPVYRIDVGPVSWNVPSAAGGGRQALLPPLQVQASVNGTTWTGVGQFMPVAPLNQSATGPGGAPVVTSGSRGTSVPSGSFFWENPKGAPAYTQLRVLAGANASPPIVLAGLPNPATPTQVPSSISVSPAKSGVDTASVAANGVDQAPLLVKISAAGQVLPSSDPAYGLVYYRDTSGDLITNLYAPGQYNQFVAVQPSAGAYPNNGSLSSTRAAVRGKARPRLGSGSPAYDYASTAFAGTENLVAHVGTAAGSTISPVNVQGGLYGPTQTGSKAVDGIGFDGCADFANNSSTCQLAAVTPGSRPALYQAGDATQGPVIGVQLQLVARNSLSDLPLQYSSGITQTALATARVAVNANGTLATIVTADKNNFTPTQNVDFSVISHGQLLPVTTLPVGGN